MKFYRAAPVNTIPAGQGTADDVGLTGVDAAGLPGAAAIIAIPVADLVSPSGRRAAESDRTALVVAGTPQIRTGDLAGVREAGRGRAGGGPPRRPGAGGRASRLITPGWARSSSSSMSCWGPA